MREKEIEFKNLLSEQDYLKLMEHFNLNEVTSINNSNYYYDKNNILKNFGAALRIRHTDTKREMTLKIKKDTFNIEINVPLVDDNIPQTLTFNSLPEAIRSELNSSAIKFDELELFQKIETFRKEKMLEHGLIVVDKTTFLGNIIDYELEFEVGDYEKGLVAFNNLLQTLEIEKKEALPKIARAVRYTRNI